MKPLVLLLFFALLGPAAPSGLLEKAPASASARHNPYEQHEDARQAGEKLFHRHCAACHGATAEGTGPVPALATPAVRNAAPGALFWVLRNGSLRRGMPSFSHLPEQQRWQIITYLTGSPDKNK